MDRPSYDSADQNPQDAWEVTKLRGQSRPNQRPRAGNRRKMMTEQDPLVCWLEILAVPQPLGRCGSLVIQAKYPNRKEAAIEPEAQREDRRRSSNEPETVYRLAAGGRYGSESDCGKQTNSGP